MMLGLGWVPLRDGATGPGSSGNTRTGADTAAPSERWRRCRGFCLDKIRLAKACAEERLEAPLDCCHLFHHRFLLRTYLNPAPKIGTAVYCNVGEAGSFGG